MQLYTICIVSYSTALVRSYLVLYSVPRCYPLEVFEIRWNIFQSTACIVWYTCSRHKTSTLSYALYTLFHTTVCCPAQNQTISTRPEQRHSDLDIWWTLSHVYDTNNKSEKTIYARFVESSTCLTDCKLNIRDRFSKR